jgi:signal transduction histidine kinase
LKLLLLVSALVLAATAAYLALAVKLFRDDKTQLIYEMNASTVKTVAAQTQSQLMKVADKVKLLTQGHRDEAWIRAVFEAEPDLIAYTLYQPTEDPAQWKAVASVHNGDFLKLYGLPATEIDRIREQSPVPFAKVLSKRSWAANATLPSGAPILTLALAIEIAGPAREGNQAVAVVDVRSDRLLKLLSESRAIATVFVVDGDGNVVAHPDSDLVTHRTSLLDVPVVRDALDSQIAFQLKQFDWNNGRWLGAFADVGIGGLKVISEVAEAEAFHASRRLVQKSLLFALVVITAALLISGWMARSFTDPISRLLAAVEKLSRWEFGGSIHVKTRDELAQLARAFNAMASDLQSQRTQLESSRTELELKVRERTAALETQKRQLSEAQDAMVRTTRLASVGELAGAAAHEVLNPVNNINIRVEKIRGELKNVNATGIDLLVEIIGGWSKTYETGGWPALEEELKKPAEGGTLLEEDLRNMTSVIKELGECLGERLTDMDFLSKEITRITRIINNMRALSRVGGERRPMDVHVPIEDTAMTLGDLFEKRKVTLVKDFSADSRDLFTVVGDRDELVQVFSNLIRNGLYAIDAAKRRAGAMKIATRRNGDRVEIRISDNGTGIAPSNMARIFEPTFTTKSVEEGTGLGLSISRRLVRAFNGDIEVESSVEGDGTTFLIWFPSASS